MNLIISVLIMWSMNKSPNGSHPCAAPYDDPRKEALVHVKDCARLMGTYVDQRASEHGMTRAQWITLGRLGRQEGLTQTEMAEILEMQPISLVRLIDRLTEQDLVERRPHPTDRRCNLLYITDKGRETLAGIAPTASEMLGHIFGGFSEAELAALSAQLDRVKTNIKNAMAAFAAERDTLRQPAPAKRADATR